MPLNSLFNQPFRPNTTDRDVADPNTFYGPLPPAKTVGQFVGYETDPWASARRADPTPHLANGLRNGAYNVLANSQDFGAMVTRLWPFGVSKEMHRQAQRLRQLAQSYRSPLPDSGIGANAAYFGGQKAVEWGAPLAVGGVAGRAVGAAIQAPGMLAKLVRFGIAASPGAALTAGNNYGTRLDNGASPNRAFNRAILDASTDFVGGKLMPDLPPGTGATLRDHSRKVFSNFTNQVTDAAAGQITQNAVNNVIDNHSQIRPPYRQY